ncbi:DNA methyltransferase [Mesorhizobium sp. B4-1-4]|uniref:DNA methyltransferase n=1 Tax=Mesorhizobium sp. B4-1-4 TaxID=2589888 RepID=UPI001126FF65|nr:DNA methyltransferase [Mesorhizobium sp. B4-1-4]UCI29441.1 site-specific DNA-methyltransferase [Mesorhizobium sp. B4-1-4]
MRHPLHAICPYFAMFPERFVAEQLLAYTRPKDLVFDPFCGRGTTVLESLLNGRAAIGSDINPVAACVAGAKAQVPELQAVLARLNALEELFEAIDERATPPSDFFATCFHVKTFAQIAFLRERLTWQDDPTDRFIAAVILGVLHGESHRSAMCLSNRMPRTISTKPDYSVRWWRERGLEPPERDAFKILRQAASFRYSKLPPRAHGKVVLTDSRKAAERFVEHNGKVALVVTSPPYLDTTDYSEDQWLRLWFLGGSERPVHRLNRDDRHTVPTDYWSFLSEVWNGTEPLLRESSTIVIRIGGTRLAKDALLEGLQSGLSEAMKRRTVRALHSGRSSEITKRQTNSFRPGTKPERLEHDFTFQVT